MLSGLACDNLGRFLQGIDMVHTYCGLNDVSRYSWKASSSLNACKFVFFLKDIAPITVKEVCRNSEIQILISSQNKSNSPLSLRKTLASDEYF